MERGGWWSRGGRGRINGGPDGRTDDGKRGRMVRNMGQIEGNKGQTTGNGGRTIRNKGRTMENGGWTTKNWDGRWEPQGRPWEQRAGRGGRMSASEFLLTLT